MRRPRKSIVTTAFHYNQEYTKEKFGRWEKSFNNDIYYCSDGVGKKLFLSRVTINQDGKEEKEERCHE